MHSREPSIHISTIQPQRTNTCADALYFIFYPAYEQQATAQQELTSFIILRSPPSKAETPTVLEEAAARAVATVVNFESFMITD
jgi:hypothetical protein